MSRFEISNINIMTGWRHNLPLNQECGICRCSLNEDSSFFQTKGCVSNIIEGECGHAYHQECLGPWIKNNKSCPICSATWKEKQKSSLW